MALDDLSADWIAQRINAPLGLALRRRDIGAGQVARCVLLELCDGDTVVASVVGKGPSGDPTSASTASAQRLYLRETSFYAELAPLIGTPTPTCYLVQRDDADNFLLLLEDMSPSAALDQFDGLTLDYVRRGLSALAQLHAPTRNDGSLHERAWLNGTKLALAPLYQAILPSLYQTFLERYADSASQDVLNLVGSFAQRLGQFSSYTSPYTCVVHGDFRTDNLLFDARGGDVPLAVVDWQTVSTSSPMLDVAYFLVTSLTSEDCIAHCDELLAYYCEESSRLGAPLTLSDIRSEFARYVLQPVSMLAPAAVIVERTERGDRMFLEMLQRASVVAEHVGALEELDRHAAS